MQQEHFYRDPILPFAEIRHSTNSGRHYKPHLHNTFSIGAIDKGSVYYNVAGEEAKLCSGALAIINPDTIHHCNPVESLVRSYYMLYLDKNWCQQIQQPLFSSKQFIPAQQIILQDVKLFNDYIDTLRFYQSKAFSLEKEQKLTSLIAQIFKQNIVCKPTPLPVELTTQIKS